MASSKRSGDEAEPASSRPAGSPSSEPFILELVFAIEAFAKQNGLTRWRVRRRRNARGEWVIVLVVEA